MSGGRIGAPPVAAVLPDGRRHFQHGPIDLVLEAFGARAEVQAAYDQAWDRFQTVLDELVAELLALRTPLYIKGPMRDPKIRPKAGPLAARGAVAAALGAIAPPLAALAFIETGPGEDTNCGQLLAEARAKGAQKKAG